MKMPKHYTLTCEKYVFRASVEHKGQLVTVGGDDLACVTLELDYYENSLILLDCFHDAQCAMNAELEKKYGTRLMLKAALTFARQLMKAETVSVQLQDESALFFDKKRINVPLADRDIFIYGKTWYQQHIGFPIRPHDKTTRSAYKGILAILSKARKHTDFAAIYRQKGNDVYEQDIRPFMFDNKVQSMKGVVWTGKFSIDLVDIKAERTEERVQRWRGGMPRARMMMWTE